MRERFFHDAATRTVYAYSASAIRRESPKGRKLYGHDVSVAGAAFGPHGVDTAPFFETKFFDTRDDADRAERWRLMEIHPTPAAVEISREEFERLKALYCPAP